MDVVEQCLECTRIEVVHFPELLTHVSIINAI